MEATISIFEKVLNKDSKMYILIGGLNHPNPNAFMDACVAKIVQNNTYSEFIDKHLDNPYIRVIITNINTLSLDEKRINGL